MENAVEHLAFIINIAFGRIEILGGFFLIGQNTPAKAEGAPAHTKDGKHDPPLKPVKLLGGRACGSIVLYNGKTRFFKKLQLVNGSDSMDALNIASQVTDVISATNGSELDQLWSRIEISVNKRNPLKIVAKTDAGKLNTALGLLYSAMEVVDTSNDVRQVRGLRSLFIQARTIVESRFLGRLEGSDKRSVQRSLDTITSYYDRVIKRFNKRVEAGEITGPEIPV